MIELDRTDRQILVLLQADGRMSNAEVAERVNLSPSACLRRVKRLEEEGLIEGYRMLDVYKRQLNARDGLFNDIPADRRELVLANFTPAQGAGAELMATFNVILDLTPHG